MTTLEPREGIEHAKPGDTPRGKRRETKERASKVAVQARRAALTAAGSSVGEGSLRGVQPSSRLARRASQNRQRHVGCHEQPVLFGREQFSCRERQLSPSTGLVNHAGGFRGAQPRLATRAQEVAAMLDETLGFHVKATGKDESLMRGQFTRMKLESLRKRTRPLENPRGGETMAPRKERRRLRAVPETTEIGSDAKRGV